MESGRPSPPRPCGSIASALVAITLAALAPLLLLHPRVSRQFRAGPALLSIGNTEATPGGRCGPFAVRAKGFYQIVFEGSGAAAFTLAMGYGDGSASREFVPPLSFDESAVVARPVIQAKCDDGAASVLVDITPNDRSSTLRITRLEVYEVSPRFYVWRALVRAGSGLGILAGVAWLGWRFYRRGVSATTAPETRRVRAFTAVVASLALGGAIYLAQTQQGRLLHDPPQPSIGGWDGSFYYFWLRSAMVEGDFDFTKDLRYCDSMPWAMREKVIRDGARTKTGLFPNKYPIGWALLEVPWYLAGDLAVQSVNACGGEIPRDGWQPLYQVFLVLGQLVYAVIGLWIAYLVLCEFMPSTAALGGVTLGWICSPLSYYQIVAIDMAHNIMFFAVAAAYLFARRLRDQPDRAANWVFVGLACAMTILARYQGAVMLLYPGVVCLRAVYASARRWRLLAVGIGASLVPLAVQALAWKAVYGSYLTYTYGEEGFDWVHPHLYQTLFSAYHGLFNWHPALCVGFAGFAAWAVVTPRRTEAICFGGSLLLTTYVNAAWWCWWFGDSFGNRAFEACTLFAMLGSGYLLQSLARRAVVFRLTTAAFAVAGVWNLALILLVADGKLPLSRPVPWSERMQVTRRYWGALF